MQTNANAVQKRDKQCDDATKNIAYTKMTQLYDYLYRYSKRYKFFFVEINMNKYVDHV